MSSCRYQAPVIELKTYTHTNESEKKGGPEQGGGLPGPYYKPVDRRREELRRGGATGRRSPVATNRMARVH